MVVIGEFASRMPVSQVAQRQTLAKIIFAPVDNKAHSIALSHSECGMHAYCCVQLGIHAMSLNRILIQFSLAHRIFCHKPMPYLVNLENKFLKRQIFYYLNVRFAQFPIKWICNAFKNNFNVHFKSIT